MTAKHLKRLFGSIAIAGLTIALALPVIAQTSGSGTTLYKTGTSVNVGQPPSNLQLSRDELEEDTHHDQIDEELDSEGRVLDINHELRLKQLEAAQTPYKPQHIADENEQYDDQKKELAQKQAIENQRHQQALERLVAAAKSLIGGAASALGNAVNGGGGSPSGPAPQPNSGANNNKAGGSPNNPAPGGASPGNPNAGSGSTNPPAPSSGGGNAPGGGERYPGGNPGGVPSNSGSGNPASNPPLNGSAATNANGAGDTGNPTLSGNASNSAESSNASPSGPGAGQRPLDFIPNALNGLVDQFQNGGQNLQNLSNATRGVAQTFEDQWTKKDGGTNQLIAMAAFHGVGGALKYLAPAIKGAAGEAAAAAPAAAAKAAAAASGIVARAKNALAGLAAKLGRAPKAVAPQALNGTVDAAGEAGGAGAVNAAENTAPQTLNGSADAAGETGTADTNPAETGPGGTNEDPGASEPAAGEPGSPENPFTGSAVSANWDNLAGKVVKLRGQTFDLGAKRGQGIYGAVYDIKNDPGSLLKVVKESTSGAESIQGQLAGTDLVQKAGIATTSIEDVSSGESNALVTKDVKTAFNRGFVPNLTEPLNGDQRAAVQRLFNQLAQNNLVWEDGGLRNIFFYTDPNGSLEAGILDSDRIFPVSLLKAQPEKVVYGVMNKTGGKLPAGLPFWNATAQQLMDGLFKYDYPG
jgi:hypothetical protein